MVLQNPKRFGLDVNANFSDVLNKNLSLQALNLPPLDLEIIRGSADIGATRQDFRSFSRLNIPLWKNLDRFLSDSGMYDSVVSSKAGTDVTLFGNLSINGSIDGNAIRYRYVDFEDSNKVKIADISTSRSSAWSSSDSRASSADLIKQGRAKISYGARVGIATGGKLVFGAQHTAASPADPDLPAVTGPRLGTTVGASEKEFKAEIPTHKIEVNIGGSAIKLYAMKGIPLIFEGVFRNLNAEAQIIQFSSGGEVISASWKIVEVDNPRKYSVFEDQGEGTSNISFRSSRSKRRFIQFYYNPDNIRFIKIQSAGITELPVVRLLNIQTIDFAFNKITDFPDFTFIAPDLRTINLHRCPLYQSSIETERKLHSTAASSGTTTNTVLDKLPTEIRNLNLRENFFGSITQNIIADRFTQLVSLNLNRSVTRSRSGGIRPYFHPDDQDANCELPNVRNTCTSYSVEYNDFRRIGTSDTGNQRYTIEDLTELLTLNLRGNNRLPNTSSQYALDLSSATKLKSLNLDFTNFNIPTGLANNLNLESVSFRHGSQAGVLIDSGGYKFNSCANLSSLDFSYSRLDGSRLPIFNNEKLVTLNLYQSHIKGGKFDGATEADKDEKVIFKETFALAPELTNLTIRSNQLVKNKSIDEEAFVQNSKLYYLYYLSFRRTNGPLPSFSGNPELYYVYMHYNAFTGILPNFASNPNIYYARFSYNYLSGTIPLFRNLTKLRYILINNNQFTAAESPENLPQLQYYYAHNNKIAGQIPDFRECPRLKNLILYNNLFTGYKTGSLSESYFIRYIDVSNCNLSQQAITQIVTDLLTNYNSVNRGGVTVNLRLNSPPSAAGLETITILKSKGWNITHD